MSKRLFGYLFVFNCQLFQNRAEVMVDTEKVNELFGKYTDEGRALKKLRL